jgi:GNAT superfamily N-acetyltransferase
MDIEQIRARYDQEQRRDLDIAGMRREVVPAVVRYVGLWDNSSVVLYSHLDETNADAVIADQLAHFATLGHEFEWKVFSHDPPPDLPDRLRAHGFHPEEPEVVMVLDVANPPDALLQPSTLDIRRLTDPDGLGDVAALEEAVWADDRGWIIRQLSAELREDATALSIYVGYADGGPVSAGWIRLDPRGQWAALHGGSTLAAYRGRGFYSALLARRVQDARARGVRFLTVDASPMSRPILEKHGFLPIATAVAYLWQPVDERR